MSRGDYPARTVNPSPIAAWTERAFPKMQHGRVFTEPRQQAPVQVLTGRPPMERSSNVGSGRKHLALRPLRRELDGNTRYSRSSGVKDGETGETGSMHGRMPSVASRLSKNRPSCGTSPQNCGPPPLVLQFSTASRYINEAVRESSGPGSFRPAPGATPSKRSPRSSDRCPQRGETVAHGAASEQE